MKHRTDWYEILSKKYTDEEIAESFVLPVEMSEEEWEKANAELREYRLKMLKKDPEKTRLISEIMKLRIQINKYFKTRLFRDSLSFGNILKKYLTILKKNPKDFASDLGTEENALVQLMQDKGNPNIKLMYRLEAHSDKMIPATYWWKLHSMQQEHLIETDEDTRKAEAARVSNSIQSSK